MGGHKWFVSIWVVIWDLNEVIQILRTESAPLTHFFIVPIVPYARIACIRFSSPGIYYSVLYHIDYSSMTTVVYMRILENIREAIFQIWLVLTILIYLRLQVAYD